MTDHPITPPPELVQQWFHEAQRNGDPDVVCWMQATAAKAAQWGADQQLAEDAKWLDHNALNEPHLRITPVGESLKEAMRTKPPRLKEQALDAHNRMMAGTETQDDWTIIRRALEQLDD